MGALEAEAAPGGRSPSCRTNPSSPARSQRSNDRSQPYVLIAAKESVGRHLQVQVVPTKMSQKQKWLKACIIDFNAATGQHKVKYMERGNREDEWLALDRTQFGWLSDPGTQPNPTYHPTLTPQKEDALEHPVLVFWPGMSKWYKGKVRSYNAATRQHVVCFHDGYIRDYDLRHEAIMWLEVPGLATREDLAHWQRLADLLPPQNGHVEDALQGPARTARSVPARKAASSRKSRLADCHPDSPASRAPPQAAPSTPASRRADALHPLIVIKGTEGAGPEGGAPASHKTVARVRDGDTGSSTSQASAEPSKRQDSSGGSMADTFPCEQQQQQGGASLADPARGACSTDLGRGASRPGPAREDDASSSARCSEGTGQQAASDADQPTTAPEAMAEEDSEAWPGMAAQPDLRRIKVRAPGPRPGRGRGGLGLRRHSCVALEPASARRRSEGLASSSPMGRAGEAVVGARIAIWWPADEAFYRGKVTSYDSYHKRSKIRYDDDEEEWLALSRQRFTCLLPRARSAGCNSQLLAAMQSLGASNIAMTAQVDASPSEADGLTQNHPDAGKQEQLVGWHITLLCSGTAEVTHGEVLGWDADTGHHLVLYDDGEHERMILAQEHITLQAPQRGNAAQTAPGLPEGEPLPKGKAAIGWRVGVYWKDDQKFYLGEVESYETATGRHIILYDDGEREPISLTKEKVKWVLPPGVHGSEEAMSDSDADHEDGEHARPSRRLACKRARKSLASPGPDDTSRPQKVARLQHLDSLPVWRLPPNPHAAVLPVIVRELGTTRELRSRHGHRLPLRGMRIFLPHMHGLVQPAMLPAIKVEPADCTAQQDLLQKAAMLEPSPPAVSALGLHNNVDMQESRAAQQGSPEPRESSPAAPYDSRAVTPQACAVPSGAIASSAPYSMIPPSTWPISVPAFSQPAAVCAQSAEAAVLTGAGPPQPLAITTVPAPEQARASDSGSPAPASMAHMQGLSHFSSYAAAAVDPPLAPPLLADPSGVRETYPQRHASCPPGSQQPACGPQDLKMLVLSADMRSSSSLPMPDTPAAAEELRCRLMHHSSSLSQADLLRPGSAGSDDGTLLAGLTHALQPPAHKTGQRRIVIPLTAEAQGQDAHKPGRFSSLLGTPGPGLGMLGAWAAGAVSRSATPPCQYHRQPQPPPQQQQQQSSFRMSQGRAGEAQPAAKGPMDCRCSPVEQEPEQAGLPCGPRAIKASAQ